MDGFDLAFQPTVGAKLKRKLASGQLVTDHGNVSMLRPLEVGEKHLEVPQLLWSKSDIECSLRRRQRYSALL